MPAGGYTDYAKVMRALPGTAKEIAQRTGMGDSGVRRVLRAFWWLKLLHPGDKKPAAQRQSAEAIWIEGDGPRADGVRIGAPMHPLSQHIAWAYLWRALQDGATKPELKELTGLTALTIQRAMKGLGAAVRIVEYERDALGRPYPVWKLGEGNNKAKPKPPTSLEKWNRYQDRKRYRVLAQQEVA